MAGKGNVFHLNKEIVFDVFHHHPQPLPVAKAYLYYFLLKVSRHPELRPFNMEEDFRGFSKTLEILEKMGYLESEGEGEEKTYRLGKKRKLPRRLSRSLWRVLQHMDEHLDQDLSTEDFLSLAGLILLKRRFPFLKTQELQVALEKLFEIRQPYRRVEELSSLAEEVNLVIEKFTKRRQVGFETAKQALA